jgi:hypothetical protein
MSYSPISYLRSRNPFVALLLQPTLHNFGALAPITPLDRITYRPNLQKNRKSFIALLLPHLFPVSPLLHYSYKKMGVPYPSAKSTSPVLEAFPTRNSFNSNNLTGFRVGPPHVSPLESSGCRKWRWGWGARISLLRSCSLGSPEPGAVPPELQRRLGPRNTGFSLWGVHEQEQTVKGGLTLAA